MAIRTYGKMWLDTTGKKKQWVISGAEPHVCIRLKNVFPRIDKGSSGSFHFPFNDEMCRELEWFLSRYALEISTEDLRKLKAGTRSYNKNMERTEMLFAPDYQPMKVELQGGEKARQYQLQAKDLWLQRQRMLLGDDMGLGKTLSAILGIIGGTAQPALVVCQAHLPKQWKDEIRRFTGIEAHIINSMTPYNLPATAVYIISYSKLANWVDVLTNKKLGIARTVIFDECQELRLTTSMKYRAARAISIAAEFVEGLSGTPIYNYGDEIWNVIDCICPDALGPRGDFIREWCTSSGQHWLVKDTQALGTYLRENYLMLRRTREDVGRELPVVNKIILTVQHDEAMAQDSMDLARRLAIKVTSGSFMERGQAAREFDTLMRHSTGVAKAKAVAGFVRLLLEAGQPVLLAGWHREVYDIWRTELEEFNPAFYTGSESPTAKNNSKTAFINGDTNLLIMSLRSGIGVDGLQQRCRDVVCGELDWSPKVHDQFTARVDRDGQQQQVNVYYPICDFGSDPAIIDVLGVKSQQSQGIMDPLAAIPDVESDEGRIRMLAERFLRKETAAS